MNFSKPAGSEGLVKGVLSGVNWAIGAKTVLGTTLVLLALFAGARVMVAQEVGAPLESKVESPKGLPPVELKVEPVGGLPPAEPTVEEAEAPQVVEPREESAGRLPSVEIIGAFMDGLMAGQMKARRVPGAVVALTSEDRPIFVKGYGFADRELRRLVGAEETLFPIASISKVFVWTAVMQLVAEGKLDLEADVNKYLRGVQVPGPFVAPVTMKHLMAHTAGFEDTVIGGWVLDVGKVRPLARLLKEEMPVRVYAPGEVGLYSNFGTCLAAHVVEQVSGLEWNDYVEQRILRPLGMTRTSFRQPLPEGLLEHEAKGYNEMGVALGREYMEQSPAGGARSTAGDMVKFMRMHLNFGRLDGVEVLEESHAKRMHAVLYQRAVGVNGMTHGFLEMNRNGHRVLGHGGDIGGYHSLMALVPGERLGFFVAFNGDGGAVGCHEVLSVLMDEFFPRLPEATAIVSARDLASPAAMERFAGRYRPVRYSHTTYGKLGVLVMQAPLRVEATGDGKLRTTGPGLGRRTWLPVSSESFQEEEGDRRLAFQQDPRGRVTHLHWDIAPMPFEKVGLMDEPDLHGLLAAVWGTTMGLACLGWPMAAWVRWRSRIRIDPPRLISGWARFLGWLLSVLLLIFFGIFIWVMRDPTVVRFGTPPLLEGAFWVVRGAAVLTVVLLLFLPALWTRSRGLLLAKVAFTWVVLVSSVALWQLFHWNVLTWPL